jgi:NAD(P)-dependent dehydrogenase (short-subunit alcohol dehydrogenase family)
MDLKLAGKIALVTGSSRGIGLATARAFAAEGCRLMLAGALITVAPSGVARTLKAQ